MERTDFYIYCYFRPDTGEPCYIGKGKGTRWKQHLYNATSKTSNLHLQRIIAKAGGEIPHVKLHVGLTNEQAIDYEIALIKAIGREPNGPLVNMTDGGEGASGHCPSSETRLKIAAKSRGRKQSPESIEKGAAKRRGQKHPQAGAKIAAKLRGRKLSPKTIALMTAWRTGRKRPPEVMINAHKARLGSKHIPETIAIIRAKRANQKPPSIESIEKGAMKNRGKKRSSESRARMTAAQQRRFYPPATGDLFASRPNPPATNLFARRS